MAHSRLSAHALAYRETTQRSGGVPSWRLGEARTCLSRSVRSRMGQFGCGMSSRGSPAARSEEVAERWASHRALHSDVWAVVGTERYRQHAGLGREYHFRSRCIGDIAAARWCRKLYKLYGRDGAAAQRFLKAVVVPHFSEPCAARGRGRRLL